MFAYIGLYHFILSTILKIRHFFLFYRWGHWGLERWQTCPVPRTCAKELAANPSGNSTLCPFNQTPACQDLPLVPVTRGSPPSAQSLASSSWLSGHFCYGHYCLTQSLWLSLPGRTGLSMCAGLEPSKYHFMSHDLLKTLNPSGFVVALNAWQALSPVLYRHHLFLVFKRSLRIRSSYNDQMSELGPREFKKHAQSHIARTGFKLEFVWL